MKKYIGNKQFYRMVMIIVVPMILQNMITNFVSMLDNIMVGQIGTAQMSGVSIVNQYVFIFFITLFGTVSGPSIFGSQFWGKGDKRGHMHTFQFRLLEVVIMIAAFMIIYYVAMDPLISLFLAKDDSPEMIAATLGYAKQYMNIILLSMIPNGINVAYSSALRECEHTKIPMYGSLVAVGVNLFLDYALIFGKCGMPQLGVAGAAIATVIAKCVEALVCVIWAHTHIDQNPYLQGMFRDFHIPKQLLVDMLKKGTPLMINEFLWVIGMSVIAQSYSLRGLDVVAARNIASTITNLFGVIYIQMGSCITIILAPLLGRRAYEEARDKSNKLLFFCILAGLFVTVIMLPFVSAFPHIYNTEENIKALASFMILISALAMPLWSYSNACYFNLRSGGRTGITFLFDFVFTWCIQIPLAFILARFTVMDIHMLFAVVTFAEIIKVFIGYFMVRSNMWIRTIVS